MTSEELLAALEAIELTCDGCGGRWIVRESGPAIMFHRCIPTRRPRLRHPELDRDEQRRAWAERQLGANPFREAVEDALGDAALRPIEGDET